MKMLKHCEKGSLTGLKIMKGKTNIPLTDKVHFLIFCLRMYYQLSPDRLSTCLVTVHGLLHIADGIPASGPVWVAWAYPIERFCGSLSPAVKSRRFPYASISRHITEVAQLEQIKLAHNLSECLALSKPKGPIQGEFHDFIACKSILLI